MPQKELCIFHMFYFRGIFNQDIIFDLGIVLKIKNNSLMAIHSRLFSILFPIFSK